MRKPWYGTDVAEALASLASSRERGLSLAEVEERRARHGWNEIAFRKTPAWVRFLRQFNDAMVIILLITAAVTALLTVLGGHMLPDTLVILAVVLLNAILGFVQEGKAESALEALQGMMVSECMVVRGGEVRRLPSRELVPGDILVLEGGDKIPADPDPGHGHAVFGEGAGLVRADHRGRAQGLRGRQLADQGLA